MGLKANRSHVSTSKPALRMLGSVSRARWQPPATRPECRVGHLADGAGVDLVGGGIRVRSPDRSRHIREAAPAARVDHGLQLGMILGFLTSFPANRWLITRGIKEGM
jgi:hypothetical protein